MARRLLLTLDQQFPDRKFKQELKDQIEASIDNSLFITSDKNESEKLKHLVILDKLEIKPNYKIHIEDLITYFRNNNFRYTHRYLEKGYYAYVCKGVHFIYGHHSFGKINTIFVNPFSYPSYLDSLKTLVDITPIECLKSYKIYRLDICLLILDRSYQEVKKCLWVSRKENLELIRKTPVGVQSQYFGEKPKRVLLYDKLAKEPNFNKGRKILKDYSHQIRCEVQLTKDTIPALKLDVLTPALLDKDFNPFKGTIYKEIEILPPPKGSKLKKWEQYFELKVLTNHIGIQYAVSSIKLFTDNFYRDYKRPYISPKWSLKFEETYHSKIADFIGGLK